MSSYPPGGKLDAAGGVEISTQFQHIDTRFSSRILEHEILIDNLISPLIGTIVAVLASSSEIVNPSLSV
jgi:hypothetical protein